MTKNLQWKLLVILAVTALSVLAIYPPEEQIRLGLDLEGGVHMVLRVQTDDALQLDTETAAEQLSEQLSLQGIELTSAVAVDPVTMQIEGVPPERDAEFRQMAEDQLSLSYEREPGVSGSYTYRMRAPVASSLRDESVRQALQTIERRVNELGVAEPIVAPYSVGGDQILVQLPGVSDVARAKEIIRSTALLELKIVEDGPAVSLPGILAVEFLEEIGHFAHLHMRVRTQLLIFLLRVELVPPFVAAASGPGALVLGRIIELVDLPSGVSIIALEPYSLSCREKGYGAEACSVALDRQRVEIRHQAPFGGQLFERYVNPLAAGVRLAAML